MTRAFQPRVYLRAGAVCAAAWLAAALPAPAAHAEELPPPQIRRSHSVPVAPKAQVPVRPRAVRARPSRPPGATRPVPGYLTGRPSEPVGRTARRRSTSVPVVGAARRSAPRPAVAARGVAVAPAPRRGRVPLTTFRIAPSPIPRRATPRTAVAPQPVRTAPRRTMPRRTTWSARAVRVASSRTGVLPAPRVAKVSPSYAELERTRAHTTTSRAKPQASSARRRTLQRRAGTPARPRRRAVRVPLAPGQCAPRPPARRTLPLLPPPGCTDDG